MPMSYSCAMPGITNAIDAGFITSIVSASTSTSTSFQCSKFSGTPSATCQCKPLPARVVIRTCARRGIKPHAASSTPAGISAIPSSIAGMAMDPAMLLGMALIPAGVLLAAWGLMPRLAQVRMTTRAGYGLHWHVADGVPLNFEHWKLVLVLVLALTIDVMKPASIAFVMPGMAHEYDIGMSRAGYLALSALIGTAVGSVAWGRLADVFGRRAAILLSALLFMGTAICGTMPSFEWNIVMCFMMGAAAGGMLPIAFTLMAETV